MKYLLFVFLNLLLSGNIYSQNIVDELKGFVACADSDCYLGKAQRNIVKDHLAQCNWWKTDTLSSPVPQIDLRKETVIPMLAIQFVNTEDYNYGDIYDCITIDSTRVFTYACLDKQQEVTSFVNFFDGVYAYLPINSFHPQEQKSGKLAQVITNLRKEQPELVLYCSTLARAHDGNGFMYIKGGKIFVFRIAECDSLELNDYIREYLTLEQIRELNHTLVLSLYRKDKGDNPGYIRRTGHAPDSEKALCPALN